MSNSRIIPGLRYDDAKTAIDFLCNAFGFNKHAVYEHEGVIVHAQLTHGNSMIMLGSTERNSEFGSYIKQPVDIGGCETQCPYVIVDDPDAHYEKAKAAGAKILLDIKTHDYGGRGYSALDSEGHIWNFGSYNPWTVEKS